MHYADAQIPQEVPGREPLDHAIRARVPIHPLPPVHIPPLLVPPHDPQSQEVDDARLHERHDVHVPVQPRLCAQAPILPREQAAGDVGRAVAVDEVVEGEGEEELVDVQGEGAEVEKAGERGGECGEGGDRGEEWVEHGGQWRGGLGHCGRKARERSSGA